MLGTHTVRIVLRTNVTFCLSLLNNAIRTSDMDMVAKTNKCTQVYENVL
jgi:hypothetical protein